MTSKLFTGENRWKDVYDWQERQREDLPGFAITGYETSTAGELTVRFEQDDLPPKPCLP